jgi:predicted nucleic-acid-binding Zn-ribbon protein
MTPEQIQKIDIFLKERIKACPWCSGTDFESGQIVRLPSGFVNQGIEHSIILIHTVCKKCRHVDLVSPTPELAQSLMEHH